MTTAAIFRKKSNGHWGDREVLRNGREANKQTEKVQEVLVGSGESEDYLLEEERDR